ncbi:hypothetical protein TWF225_003373 [Orbilia oligospora]|nr:hypothetical protein TWF225_003373 [Orbilia oligospora]KAF3240255.1 hypothetical protein TWF217_000845 [Orbilia oligospora]KAF3258546.1 hypothetical protein TWF128_004769 [Orbilia oligospora]KAF3281308.1 hypothetical protein TWF132_011308 [Orbilia oligospora]
MSDIKATTEAPSAAAPTVEPTVEATPEIKQETAEPTPVDKTEDPAQAEATEPAAENAETPAEAPKEIEPISEGVLETKFLSVIPIFLKKHTFYFSEEAIPEENLGEYLKKEKTKAGHATYAHATQTGKGLLFYTKADKTKPTGIVRLDGADITTQGDKKFTIKSAGHELQLEANTAALRERWVHTLKIKVAESEGIHATTSETDGFKAALEKLTKPAPVVAAKKEEPVDAKKEGEEAEETPAEVTAPAVEEEAAESSVLKPEEEKKDEKKRSSSRNRLNRFSFFGKKEEKKDEVKEEQPPVAEVKEETAPATAEAPVVPLQETTPVIEEPAPVAPQAEATPTEEPKAETSPVTSPKASNRKSFLGGLFAKKKEEKKDSPAVEEEGEAKSPEAVPETEAQVAPATNEPLPDAGEQPAAVETQEPVKSDTEAESPRERKPSGIFGSLRRDKSTDGEDKPRRSLSFWKKDKEKKGKEEAQPTAITESEPQAEATTEEPVKTEPLSIAPVLPDVPATESEKKITDLPTAPAVTVGDGSKA